MSDTIIKVQNLSKVYKLYDQPKDRLKEALHPFRKKYHKEFYALKDISFEIKRGESIGIIGKNGAGKSTLLKILTGVLTPTTGTVEVRGKIAALLELGSGFNPELSGMENIYFQGAIMGFTYEEMQVKVPQIVEFADIGEFINQPVKTYSSGMFARLAFSIAINVEPDILIVDEALSVGDSFFQAKCMFKVNELITSGVNFIFVSHSDQSISDICNKVICLQNGELGFYGSCSLAFAYYRKANSNFVKSENHQEVSIVSCEKALDDYGSLKAKITDLKLYNDKGEESDFFYSSHFARLIADISCYDDINNGLFGFSFRNINGLEIFGINTFIATDKLFTFRKDKKYQISFEFKVPSSAGELLLTSGVVSILNGNIITHNRLENVRKITVGDFKSGTGVAALENVVLNIKEAE